MTVPFVSPALLADPAPAPNAMTLVNAIVFDGTGSVPRPGEVNIAGGRITSGPHPDARRIDLEGRFVMSQVRRVGEPGTITGDPR